MVRRGLQRRGIQEGAQKAETRPFVEYDALAKTRKIA